MNKKRIIALVFGLGVIVFWQYFRWKNGAFETPDIQVMTQSPYIINGYRYQGMDTEMRHVLDSVRIKLENSGKQLPTIYYSYKEMAQDDHKIDMIVGVIVEDSSTTIDDSFGFYVIPERKIIRGHIHARGTYVQNIDEAIVEYAEENNIKYSFSGMAQWKEYSEEPVGDYYLDFPIKE